MMKKEQGIAASRLRTSYLSSIISTSLVLFLLGVVGILIFNANKLSSSLRDNIEVSVILEDHIEEQQAMRILNLVEKEKYVRKVKYVSKEAAVQDLQSDLGQDFMELLGENPLPIILKVTVEKEYFSSDSVNSIKDRLMTQPEIKDVIYQKSLLDVVSKNTEKISIIILIFVLLLLFVSIFLINNTIRLTIYSKRFLINTMKLVGANTSFIRTPFLASSVWQGLISGFISIILLIIFVTFLKNDFSELLELTNGMMFGIVFAGMLILGSLISFISTYLIVTKYTKLKDTEELYY